jgi:tol-pal system protein YbgF
MRRLETLVLLGAVISAPAFAAVPVVESQGTNVRGGVAAPAGGAVQTYPATQSYPSSSVAAESYPVVAAAEPVAGNSGGSAQSEIFYQLQTLQSEVQELRGLVEEQRHLIERLEKQQKEQYLDVDRRIVALQQGGASAAPPSTGGVSFGGGTTGATTPSTEPKPPAAAGASERELYERGIGLTRERQFAQAIDAFNQVIVEYPNGTYASNSYYWLGACHLSVTPPDLERARQSFQQVLALFPNSPKVPDSLYKLGEVHHRMGDTVKALDYFDQVQRRFPATPSAQLAREYAARIR